MHQLKEKLGSRRFHVLHLSPQKKVISEKHAMYYGE